MHPLRIVRGRLPDESHQHENGQNYAESERSAADEAGRRTAAGGQQKAHEPPHPRDGGVDGGAGGVRRGDVAGKQGRCHS